MNAPSPLDAEQQARLERLIAEFLQQQDQGPEPDGAELLRRHPDLSAELRAFLADQEQFRRMTIPLAPPEKLRPTSLVAKGHPLPQGTLVGPYQLERLLGHGGMGTVYRATHVHLKSQVAIKILAPALARDAQFVQRFEREARALARLRHDCIVQIHDMGTQGDLYYFVMELVDGVDLRSLLRSGPLTTEQALEIVPQVCAALEYAHQQGIVHRDIKPENILIDRAGTPKIADFGLARILRGDDSSHASLTRTDMLVGTRNYMAPEQWHTAKVDHRADIYAVGVVLYEMLTGQLPVGNFPPPSKKGSVHAGIDQIVLKALERDPAERYQQASQLASDVSGLLTRSSAAGHFEGVVDLKTGQSLLPASGSLLRILSSEDERITVRGWSRSEIGVQAGEDGAPQLHPIGPGTVTVTHGNVAGLEIVASDEPLVVHVPAGCEIELRCPEAPVVAQQTSGALVVWAGEEHVKVTRHDGPLRVERTAGGDIEVHDYSGESLELRTQDGDITVTELRMTQGTATLQSLEGDLDVLVVPEEVSFTFELSSVVGWARASVAGQSTRHYAQRTTGTLGTGTGRLQMSSTDGSVLLRANKKRDLGHRHRRTRKSAETFGQTLFWLFMAYLVWRFLFH